MKPMRDEEKGQNFIRGSHITFQNLEMFFTTLKQIGLYAVYLFLGIVVLYVYWMVSRQDLYFFYKYEVAHLMVKLTGLKGTTYIVYDNETYLISYAEMFQNSVILAAVAEVWASLIEGAIVGGLAVVLVTAGVSAWFIRTGRKLGAAKFVRGAKLVSNDHYIRLAASIPCSDIQVPAVVVDKRVAKRDYRGARVKHLPLPLYFEVQHMLIHGTIGAGKSQLILALCRQIIASKRPSKRIMVDVGCNLVSELYRPGDLILNPFDRRSVFWDIFEEFQTDVDFRMFASYLIPMPAGMSDPFWINAPRSILASVAYTMQDDPERSVKALLDVLLLSEIAELCEYLDESEAKSLVSDKVPKTTLSIRGVIATYVYCLKYLIGMERSDENGREQPAFSIKNWIQDEKATGTLFICLPEDKREEMRGLVTLWVSRAIDALLALAPSPDRRVYFICDEIGVMNKIDKFQTGMGLGRKYGFSFILGMQSYNQFVKIYGETQARELLDFMNTKFFFKSNEETTAKFVSASLGEEEVETATLNRTYGGHHRERQNVSMINQVSTKPVVTYSEILELKNLECYMKVSEGLPITKVHLKPIGSQALCPGLVPRVLDAYQPMEDLVKNVNEEALHALSKIRVKKKTDLKKRGRPSKKSNNDPVDAEGSEIIFDENGEIIGRDAGNNASLSTPPQEVTSPEEGSDSVSKNTEKAPIGKKDKVSKYDEVNDLVIHDYLDDRQ